jgi:methyl halide transferase
MVNDIEKWNTRYQTGDTPWETGAPHEEMQQVFKDFVPKGSKVLEIGCGVGTNAEWLATAGYKVTGTDVSEVAISKARERAASKHLQIEYAQLNFLKDAGKLKAAPVIFDCAVFHIFHEDEMAERLQFVKNIAQVCEAEGLWINISCSEDDAEKIKQESNVDNPPNLSLRALVSAVEPAFEILQIQKTIFNIERAGQGKASYKAWITVMKKR